MSVLAIDPGNEQSAYVKYDGAKLLNFGKVDNDFMLNVIAYHATKVDSTLAIEMIASYGMPVGREVFETCVWIGRFVQKWCRPHTLVFRRDVKLHLCGNMRAKDGNVRAALIDKFGGPSRIKKGGPLYKVSKDVWSALAVAVTWTDTQAIVQPAPAYALVAGVR